MGVLKELAKVIVKGGVAVSMLGVPNGAVATNESDSVHTLPPITYETADSNQAQAVVIEKKEQIPNLACCLQR